jgi:hypothetical protein
MNRTILAVEMPRQDTPIVLDLGAIYRQFLTLADGRKRRGLRYPLAVLLTIAVLAKLSGYSQVTAIADWARARADALADLFDLARRSMPHEATWTRVFAQALAITALEQAVARLSASPSTAEIPAPGSLIVNLDGKTLRGPSRWDRREGCICWPPTRPTTGGCWHKWLWRPRLMKSARRRRCWRNST